MSRWFLPNPASVSPEVLAAQVTPPGSGTLLQPAVLSERLKEFFFPDAHTAAFFSCLREGMLQMVIEWFSDRNILMIVNGPMSQEWYDIADDCHAKTTVFDSAYGSAIDMNAFAIAVRKERFDLLLFVETDACLGCRIDPEPVSRMFRQSNPEGLIALDISGSVFCGTENTDIRFADICVCGSEMAMGLPPGLGIAILNERAHTRVLAHNTMNGRYFNYPRQTVSRSPSALDVPPYTLLNALNEQIDGVLTEGMDARIERLAVVRNRIYEWMYARGFALLCSPDTRALNSTSIGLPVGISQQDVVDYAARYGIFLAAGTGLMPENSLMIYHGNDTRPEDVSALLRVLERFLNDYDTRRRRQGRGQQPVRPDLPLNQ